MSSRCACGEKLEYIEEQLEDGYYEGILCRKCRFKVTRLLHANPRLEINFQEFVNEHRRKSGIAWQK